MYSENSEEEKENQNLVERIVGKFGSTQFFITLSIIAVCFIIYFTKAYNHFSNTPKHVHFADELIMDNISWKDNIFNLLGFQNETT